MMRIDVQEQIDGVSYHAEVEGVEAAREFLQFLGTLRTAVKFAGPYPEAETQPGVLVPLPNGGYVEYTAGQPQSTLATFPPQPPNLGVVAEAPKWTRENLQPVVIALAKQRDKFMALLQQFGVARFRDLPDDKLHDFGVACEGVTAQ